MLLIWATQPVTLDNVISIRTAVNPSKSLTQLTKSIQSERSNPKQATQIF